jgi:hypothetical protein
MSFVGVKKLELTELDLLEKFHPMMLFVQAILILVNILCPRHPYEKDLRLLHQTLHSQHSKIELEEDSNK